MKEARYRPVPWGEALRQGAGSVKKKHCGIADLGMRDEQAEPGIYTAHDRFWRGGRAPLAERHGGPQPISRT
jgi:hypothetical protein